MSIRKNMISSFTLAISNFIFPIITFPYITRIISNDSIGKVFFVDACTQYFITFASFGIPAYAVREIAKIKNLPRQYSQLVSELLIIQVTLSILFSLLFISIPIWSSSLHNHKDLIRISCITIISTSFMMDWFYQAMEKYTFITIRSVVVRILGVILILLFVKTSDDYLIYYSIPAVITLINTGINFGRYLARHHVASKENLKPLRHIKPLLILFAINVSVSVYTVLDTIILGMLTDPVSVSFYSVPLRLVKMVWAVAASLGIVFVPRIASFYKASSFDLINLTLSKSFSIISLVTLPFALFCILLPREILFTVAGDKYIEAYQAVQILALLPFIIGVCNVMGTQFLIPSGNERRILQATVIGLSVSLLLNFFMIPLWGYIGTSMACLASELVVCLYIFFYAQKIITLSIDYNILFLIFISALPVILLKHILASHFTNQSLLLISGLIYLATFVLLQIIYFKNAFLFSIMKIKLTK